MASDRGERLPSFREFMDQLGGMYAVDEGRNVGNMNEGGGNTLRVNATPMAVMGGVVADPIRMGGEGMGLGGISPEKVGYRRTSVYRTRSEERRKYRHVRSDSGCRCRVQKKRTRMDAKTSKMVEEWYISNAEGTYPQEETKLAVAEALGITHQQVEDKLANHRQRKGHLGGSS